MTSDASLTIVCNVRNAQRICYYLCSFNQTETLSTVRFGSRAKNIKNKPKVNMTRSLREVEGLLEASEKQVSPIALHTALSTVIFHTTVVIRRSIAIALQ
jgi:hypothetical protein